MREESLQNIQNNQYVGGGTGTMNAMYFAFGNPITDSMVVNAFAKTNSAAFEIGLKTGVYGNNTVLGGNFLYNTLNNNKYTGKLFKNAKSGSVQPFKNFKLLGENSKLRNLSWNFLSSGDIEGTAVTKLADETGLNKTSEIVRTGWGFGKNYSGFFDTLKKMGYNPENFHDRTIEHTASKVVGHRNVGRHKIEYSYKKFQKGLDWNSANLSDDVLNVLRKSTDDEVIKLADEFLNIGGALKTYSKGTKVITNEIKEELAGAIGKQFASRTTFQKIISSPLVRVATGAAISLPVSAALPLMAAQIGVSVIASTGQDNAINNFINSNLYNETQYDRYSSQEAMSSLYSASSIRDVNLQALVNAYSNVNVANRYLNDMDSISSDDYKYSSDDAEVI